MCVLCKSLLDLEAPGVNVVRATTEHNDVRALHDDCNEVMLFGIILGRASLLELW